MNEYRFLIERGGGLNFIVEDCFDTGGNLPRVTDQYEVE